MEVGQRRTDLEENDGGQTYSYRGADRQESAEIQFLIQHGLVEGGGGGRLADFGNSLCLEQRLMSFRGGSITWVRT